MTLCTVTGHVICHVTLCDTLYSSPTWLYQLLCSSMWIVTVYGGFDPEQIVTHSMLNRPRLSHTQLLHLVKIHNKIHIIGRQINISNSQHSSCIRPQGCTINAEIIRKMRKSVPLHDSAVSASMAIVLHNLVNNILNVRYNKRNIQKWI